MSRLTRDPELDQLVRSINERGRDEEPVPHQTTAPPWPPAEVAKGNPVEPLLAEMTARGASDLLIMADAPAIFRVGGRPVEGEGPPLAREELPSLFASLLTPRVRQHVEAEGAADFSL